jgi:hypothetical protein
MVNKMHTFVNGAFEAAAYTNMIAGAGDVTHERREREKTETPTLVDRVSLNAGRVTAGLVDIGVAAYCAKFAVDNSDGPWWIQYAPLMMYGGAKLVANLATLALKVYPFEKLAN